MLCASGGNDSARRAMSVLTQLTRQLSAAQPLTASEIDAACAALSGVAETDESKAAFLLALGAKGETAGELAGFARAFRRLAINPGFEAWAPRAIDVVGTGGDHAGGFNVSSMVVLVLACAGVPVIKHGNRGITSKCGSADLLAALGVDLAASPDKLRAALDQLGYVFLFAPNFHPAFKHIAPVRKLLAAQGRRSIFNILGPLVNPAQPGAIVLGVYSAPLVEKMAAALTELGQPAGLVGHGVITAASGIDELTTATANQVQGVGRLAGVKGVWRAEDFGLKTAPFAELQGGDLTANLAIVEALLSGSGPAGLADTIVFNAAVALHVAGRTATVQEGLAPARDWLLGGAVRAKIAATREFYRS